MHACCMINSRTCTYFLNYIIMVHACRDTVMELMRQLDPTGVVARQNHRLTRRVYFSKVYYAYVSTCIKTQYDVFVPAYMHFMVCRVQIFYGIWTDTISCHPTIFVYMDALTGTVMPYVVCFLFPNNNHDYSFRFSRRLMWLRLGTTNHDPCHSSVLLRCCGEYKWYLMIVR